MKKIFSNKPWIRASSFYIRHLVFVQEQKITLADEFDHLDTDETYYVVLFNNDMLPISTARFVDDLDPNDKTFRICRVATLKEFRGRGYGSQCILELEQYGKEKGFKKSLIHADCTALPFYQSLGYQVCSEIFVEDGVDCVLVNKELI